MAMSILHMETETVQESGRLILRTATNLLDTLDSLEPSIHSLSGVWQSDASSDYLYEAGRILLQIQKHIQELDVLSQRVMNEAQQWIETDGRQAASLGRIIRFLPNGEETGYMLSGILLASSLGWSSLRPNSMIFSLPNDLRETIHLPAMLRVIKPATLLKKMAAVAYIQNAVEGVSAGVDTYRDPSVNGTNRALPAAIVDGLVKTAINASGTTVLLGTSALIIAAVPLFVATGAPVVAGGAVLVTWVVGDVVLSKVAEQPAWDSWKHSYQRDQAIEGMTRFSNSVNHWISSTAQDSVRTVDRAFHGFIHQLTPLTP